MSPLNLKDSLRRAEQKLPRASSRRRRADAGRSRLHPRVLQEVRSLALTQDRPPMVELQRRVAKLCAREGLRPPSRASLYNVLPTLPGHSYRIAELPPHVRPVLYNLDPDGEVPGHQLAFYCFNYGPLAAVSFAAGLPWLDLYQAARSSGWRARSRGLLLAAMRARGIR